MVSRTTPGADQDTDANTDIDGGPFAAPLMPGTMVGEYRVEAKIGEGGMGTVYGAVHPVIGKKAAIKLLRAELSMNPEAVERFLGEARAVNQIGHPNIVDVFSFGALPDGRRYFAMEWLRGESLAARIDRDGGLVLAEALPILEQVVAALAAAHERGIVHRDLKPDNVFLCEVRGEAPRVKLLDFGIAKLVGEPLGIKRTKTGALMGTPGYIAPEQARGEDIDARADVYALGCMTFEVLTGRLPFVSESAMVVITKHLTEDPPAPSSVDGFDDLPPEVDGLVLSMLAKDRDARPGLDDIRTRLTAFGRAETRLGAGGARPRRAKGISRAPTAAPAAGAVGATGVIVAAVPVSPDVTLAPRPTRGAELSGGGTAAARPSRGRWIVAGLVLAAAVAAVVGLTAGGSSGAGAASPAGSSAAAPPAPAPPPSAPPPEEPATIATAPGTAIIKVTGARAAVVTIDGAPQPLVRGVARATLAPGAHELVVTARRMRSERRQLIVTSGQAIETELALVPERSTAPRPPTGSGAATGASAGPGSGAGTGTPDDDALVDPFHKRKPSGATP
ncbi:MAG: serine/threonine protein kinase [Myxococcales bacterium]|nr:serine/threonine protein kinase [Myxococcales bacterium]